MRSSILWLPLALGCVQQPLADDDGGTDWTSWDDGDVAERRELRVATWNVEGVGAVGSDEHEAMVAVLRRLDADVVGLNEVDAVHHDALGQAAAALGYAFVATTGEQPFGGAGNAMLSRLEELSTSTPDAAALSGDPSAKDLTRLPIVATFAIPGSALELTVVAQHWKSGFELEDAFRRSVDAWRTRQASELGASSELRVVLGDVNQEPGESPGVPATFTSAPGQLPFTYDLGADLAARLRADGIPNDPFGVLAEVGLTRVAATQRDGDAATRPVSGRVIDHVFVNEAVADGNLRAEVYDAEDEDVAGLADGGEPLGPMATRRASDHLPVLVVFELPPE